MNGRLAPIPSARRSRRLLLVLSLAGALVAVGLGCGSDSNGPTGVGVDSDRDGVGDAVDNCPLDVNAEQFDSDGDGVGNVCDNCPSIPNPGQENLDGVGAGDACSGFDADADGLPDGIDNCPLVFNPNQRDEDQDGVGDPCDPDLDGDGLVNNLDLDRDGDGVRNDIDTDPDDPRRCGDGDGDSCDDCTFGPRDVFNDGPDSDGDGFCDQGVGVVRLVVGVESATEVFGVAVAVAFDPARVAPVEGGEAPVVGLGPYDPASYFPTAPAIEVSGDADADGRVDAGATFLTITPDPSFDPPADVLGVDFTWGPIVPTLLDFGVLDCEIVDREGEVVLGAACVLRELQFDP